MAFPTKKQITCPKSSKTQHLIIEEIGLQKRINWSGSQ